MKGLIYGIAISFFFSLTACSEAQFSSANPTSQKAQINDEEIVAVDEVPERELDDYIEHYKCSEAKKRSCAKHDSEELETASSKKALVCHNGKTEICISKNALKAHIARHGRSTGIEDYFGECVK